MDRGPLGAIFWKLHSAFLLNKREDARKMMGLLLEEGKGANLEVAFGPIHHERFLRIQDSMSRNSFGRLYGEGEATPALNWASPVDASGPEKEFHAKLKSKTGKAELFRAVGIHGEVSLVHELDMGIYGRCDFLAREGRTWHVIEIKVGEPDHSVIAQIEKYRLALELDMINGLHDCVTATVVAESFSQYVANELSKIAVRMVSHSGTPESLRVLA